MGGETNHATSASASVKMPASDRIAHILEMSDDLHDMDFMNVKPSNPSTRNYSFIDPSSSLAAAKWTSIPTGDGRVLC